MPLSGATKPGQSAPGSNGNEGVLRIPQNLQHYWNLAIKLFRTLIGMGVLPLSRDAVGIFYSPNRLGNQMPQHYINTDNCHRENLLKYSKKEKNYNNTLATFPWILFVMLTIFGIWPSGDFSTTFRHFWKSLVCENLRYSRIYLSFWLD